LNAKSTEERVVYKKLNSTETLIQRTTTEAPLTGWIHDYLLPHAQQVKVAHPLMLRAIAAAKKKND
jgi:hypothetical protein